RLSSFGVIGDALLEAEAGIEAGDTGSTVPGVGEAIATEGGSGCGGKYFWETQYHTPIPMTEKMTANQALRSIKIL
ncbi:MAG: hypothetical protein ABIP97_07330, partial [Chthoniobacterales bacterium]